jgi:hypothetical protein
MAPRGGRFREQFGPFRIYEMWPTDSATGDKIFSGLCLLCCRHHEVGIKADCAKHMDFGKHNPFSEHDVIVRLKQWALRGYQVHPDDEHGRSIHMKDHGADIRKLSYGPLSADELSKIPPDKFAGFSLDGL